MKDLYNILGISKDADEKEIKKAYRKLSLQYHPDKQTGKSEEEQKEAESKMQEINEAYSVLSDKEKRSNYDRFGSANGPADSWQSNGWGGYTETQIYQGTNAFAKCKVSIKDLYEGNEVFVKYQKRVRCSTCDGKGYDHVDTCPFCHGTGMEVIEKRIGNTYFRQQGVCRHCHGTGKIHSGNECKDCHGTGLVFKESEVKIKPQIQWFIDTGDDDIRIRLRGAGDEHSEYNSIPGDLIVEIVRDWDVERYEIVDNIDGPTIMETIDVNVFDALTGCKHELQLPDESKIRLNVPKLSYEGKILNIKGKGLKIPYNDARNTYKLKIHVTMPEDLNDKQIKLLNKIKSL